jgi:hypothetical protein
VEAAHVRPEDTKRLSVWTPAVLYADYDTWTTSRPAHGRIRPDRVEDWFDRERQRSIAYSHVTNLVRHERRGQRYTEKDRAKGAKHAKRSSMNREVSLNRRNDKRRKRTAARSSPS